MIEIWQHVWCCWRRSGTGGKLMELKREGSDGLEPLGSMACYQTYIRSHVINFWAYIQIYKHIFKICIYMLFFFYIIQKIYLFNWRIIALQCCIGFCHTSTWIDYRYVSSLLNLPPPPATPFHPSRLSSRLSSLHHTGSFCWLSVLHMVTYVF